MDTVDNPFKHAAGLSAVWQKCMSEVYGSEFRFLIDREHGQLKLLKESLGMKRATEVVEYAIRNWGKFAQTAAKTAGSDIFPSKPTIGWLSKYHATALMMLEHESQSIAKEKAFQAQVASTKAQWLETVKADESPRATQVPKDAASDHRRNRNNHGRTGFGKRVESRTVIAIQNCRSSI